MEIVTYVRTGAITHMDNRGNRGRTAAGSRSTAPRSRSVPAPPSPGSRRSKIAAEADSEVLLIDLP
jgi:hypothetical protein